MNVQMPPYFQNLLSHQSAPCVSLYMPTLRAKPPAAENHRRLKNLLRRAEDELRRTRTPREYQPILEKLNSIMANDLLWQHPGDALAAFASPDVFETVKLNRPIREMLHVGDSFHLKPLIRAQQFDGRFHVLCIGQRFVALREASRDDLRDLPLQNVPHDIFEALHIPRQREAAGTELAAASISGGADLDRYLRAIDRAIWETYSRPAGLPLMLCALERYHDAFHRVTRNPNLMKEGIKLNPERLSPDRLHEEAWRIMRPYYDQQIQKVIDEYALARARKMGSEDVAQVAHAATSSRVGVLLVDADKQISGRMDPESGDIRRTRRSDLQDLLDDIAEKVIKTGGQVLVMPHDQMPSNTGVAAIYRY